MNNFKYLYFSLTLLFSNIYHSQLISDKWYQLYDSEGIRVEISFSISKNDCSENALSTIYKYRYNGKLLDNLKFVNWSLDYINCNGLKYTYSSGAKIGGFNIQNELGKGLLEDFIKEEFDDAITTKKITSNLYKISTSFSKLFSNKEKTLNVFFSKSFSNKEKTLNSFNGFDIVNYPNGDIYEGNLKNNKFHGKGKYTYKNSSLKGRTTIKEGEWEEGEFINGNIYLEDMLYGEYIDGIFWKISNRTLENRIFNKLNLNSYLNQINSLVNKDIEMGDGIWYFETIFPFYMTNFVMQKFFLKDFILHPGFKFGVGINDLRNNNLEKCTTIPLGLTQNLFLGKNNFIELSQNLNTYVPTESNISTNLIFGISYLRNKFKSYNLRIGYYFNFGNNSYYQTVNQHNSFYNTVKNNFFISIGKNIPYGRI